jgi:hypothetical protein
MFMGMEMRRWLLGGLIVFEGLERVDFVVGIER